VVTVIGNSELASSLIIKVLAHDHMVRASKRLLESWAQLAGWLAPVDRFGLHLVRASPFVCNARFWGSKVAASGGWIDNLHKALGWSQSVV